MSNSPTRARYRSRRCLFILAAASGLSACVGAHQPISTTAPADKTGGAVLESRDTSVADKGQTGNASRLGVAKRRVIASSELTYSERELSEIRGGFVTFRGLQFDFGYEMSTFVNGTESLTSRLTLSDIVNGVTANEQLGRASTASDIPGGGSTEVIHTVQGSSIGATIVNTQNSVNIENYAKLTIDVLGFGRVRRGGALGGGRTIRAPKELIQSLTNTLPK